MKTINEAMMNLQENEINDKDTIFLDASTASYMIAKLIV